MCGFLLRIIINAVLLFLVIGQLSGIFVDTLGGMLLGVLIIGIVNAALRPILMLTTRSLHWLHSYTIGDYKCTARLSDS